MALASLSAMMARSSTWDNGSWTRDTVRALRYTKMAQSTTATLLKARNAVWAPSMGRTAHILEILRTICSMGRANLNGRMAGPTQDGGPETLCTVQGCSSGLTRNYIKVLIKRVKNMATANIIFQMVENSSVNGLMTRKMAPV